MLANDLGLDSNDLEAKEPLKGSLLKWNTISRYISAIAKLHGL
jgi:hypothetical protein